MPASDSIWTALHVGELRALWDSGLSTREIADRLGGEFTRGAVIGKASRIGLARHKAPRRPPVEPRKVKPVLPSLPPPPPLPPEPVSPPHMRRLQLVDLADHHCRWPVGNPAKLDFFFCGADAPHTVYCPFHMRVAFARPRQGD